MTNHEKWEEEVRYCTRTECLTPTPKYYRVVFAGEEIDFGLCFQCAHELLLTLPVDATIEEQS